MRCPPFLVYGDTMEEPKDTLASPELPITFQGREIYVRMPTPDQLVVWQRTVRMLQREDLDWTADTVMTALDRSRRIIGSLFVSEKDNDWLDDEMLDGRVGLKDTAQIIQLTVEAFADAAKQGGNRATRRAPAKKAAKKASR